MANAADDIEALVTRAVSALDKAATKGVIHRNNASRGKSRLMKRLNTLAAPTAPADGEEQAAPKKARGTTRSKAGSGTSKTTGAGRTRVSSGTRSTTKSTTRTSSKS